MTHTIAPLMSAGLEHAQIHYIVTSTYDITTGTGRNAYTVPVSTTQYTSR